MEKKQIEERLGKYHIEMKYNTNRPTISTYKLDKKGVLIYKIPYTNSFDYYPVSITLYALGNFEMHLDTNNDKYIDNFLKQVDWLVNNISIKDDFGVWEHKFVIPYYNFNRVPWVHGMAQGLAISSLLRAYQLTSNKVYLETAEKAYGAFQKDINDGGVRYIDKEGNAWLEEYAIQPPPHILNGFIFALFGVYDFYRVTKNNNALALWNKGINTLEKNLFRYNTKYWSLYNLLQKYPATKKYHNLHIKQLNVLYEMTSRKIFKNYALKWNSYGERKLNLIRGKTRRGMIHLRRHGLIDCIKQYRLKEKWMK